MRHHIQMSILDRLAHGERLRYTDLNTYTLDGNVFTYHVKQLRIDSLIQQHDDKTYSLTQVGKAFVVNRYEDSAWQAHSIFLVILECDAQLLLRERLVQPMLGYTGFIHGEPVVGLSIEQAAAERVLLKTGLAVSPEVVSGGFITIKKGDELESYSHVVLLRATADSTELPLGKDDTGRNMWIAASELGVQDRLLPSCADLMRLSPGEWFDLRYTV